MHMYIAFKDLESAVGLSTRILMLFLSPAFPLGRAHVAYACLRGQLTKYATAAATGHGWKDKFWCTLYIVASEVGDCFLAQVFWVLGPPVPVCSDYGYGPGCLV